MQINWLVSVWWGRLVINGLNYLTRNYFYYFMESWNVYNYIQLHFRIAIMIFKSSGPDVFSKKGVLRSFIKFTGKHQCQSLFFNKVTGLRPATLFRKRNSGTSLFLWIVLSFLEHLLLQNTSVGCLWDLKQINTYRRILHYFFLLLFT